MTPFKDKSIGLIEKSNQILTSAPRSDTILFDDQRQGIEVTLVNYFFKSTKAYISSKGLAGSQINSRLVPELDMRDLGQQISIDEFSAFQDEMGKVDAATILSEGLVSDESDPFFGENTQDGLIVVFSDTGKRTARFDISLDNKRGISTFTSTLPIDDTYDLNADVIDAYYDGVETTLGIPTPGFASIQEVISPFNEKDDLNGLKQKIMYNSIGTTKKTFPSGFTFYDCVFGTDSITFGGRLR